MPSQIAHVTRAEHNEQFYGAIGAPHTEYTDWAVVALFYAALHYVDAVLATGGLRENQPGHPQNHRDRLFALAGHPKLTSVNVHYLELYHRSKDARYRMVQFAPREASRLHDTYYAAVKSHIRAILQLD